MKHNIAEIIGRKAKALKHCDKVLAIVDKNGRTDILLGNTGIVLPCEKNDAMHVLLQSIRYKIAYELDSIKITSTPTAHRALPAPVGACDRPKTHHCVMCGASIVKNSGRHKYCKECAQKAAAESRRKYRDKCKNHADVRKEDHEPEA